MKQTTEMKNRKLIDAALKQCRENISRLDDVLKLTVELDSDSSAIEETKEMIKREKGRMLQLTRISLGLQPHIFDEQVVPAPVDET